ncbi:MAG: hypothetical protein EOP84_25300 [Verrucomicrobiaceae bacterium]|nr:MAG: hypothetical protein EOP84_25300 [Verrucomicrobiaceae bacterium]
MTDSLENERFSWVRDPRPESPFRIKPYVNGVLGTVSYRRCVTLAEWCDEQFGHSHTRIDHQVAHFEAEHEMMLFVTFWSGISIDTIAISDLQKKKPSGF